MESSIIIVSILYLGLIFGLAYAVEKGWGKKFLTKQSGWVYALSLGVYCTAWTFYGSIGRAQMSGIDFLAIYLGPTVIAPLWWIIIRKLVRISKKHGISSLADFIGARYGKRQSISALVATVLLLGVTPYLSLQIKAISESLQIATKIDVASKWYLDPAVFITIIMTCFVVLFGTRYLETNKPKTGIVTVVAFESVFKMVAFLLGGGFIVYGYFQGPSDIFAQASEALPNFYENVQLSDSGDWFWLILISGLSVFLLPRQFQVAIAENLQEQDLKKAMWVFPLYLLLINLFVLPIAFAGILTNHTGDYTLLSFAKENGAFWVILIYLGGLSAATAMLIVSSLALGQMLSNNLILPTYIKKIPSKPINVIRLRQISIAVVLFLAYLYYQGLGKNESLISIGIVSFIAVSQLAPAIIIGTYWKKASSTGVWTGITAGMLVWFVTVILPSINHNYDLNIGNLIHLENPLQIAGLSPTSNAIMLSLFCNLVCFIGFSVHSKPGIEESNQAELFVDVFKFTREYESNLYSASTSFPNIQSLLFKFLGEKRTEEVLNRYARINNLDWKSNPQADSRMISYAERLLTEAIGPASARIMIASVVQEEDISINEVVNILKESQEVISLNRQLKQQSEQLQALTKDLQSANDRLKKLSEIKDDFLYTVTHELRTPLTSIRSQAELLLDMGSEMEPEEEKNFLQTMVRDCERLTRLISDVLDLEKFESGNQKLNIRKHHIQDIIHEVIGSMRQTIEAKNIQLEVNISDAIPTTFFDYDRMVQVFTNLLSNAMKFCDQNNGRIRISSYQVDKMIKVNVIDNGDGIDAEKAVRIFDKFYQAHNQMRKKPSGTGLGLAICKNIVQLHGGKIYMLPEAPKGTRFSFEIPIYKTNFSQHG